MHAIYNWRERERDERPIIPPEILLSSTLKARVIDDIEFWSKANIENWCCNASSMFCGLFVADQLMPID